MKTENPGVRKVRIDMPDAVHRSFKAWCVQEGKTLSEGLMAAVVEKLDRENMGGRDGR